MDLRYVSMRRCTSSYVHRGPNWLDVDLCSIAIHCIALQCIASHCIALQCIALHCIAVHRIALQCIACIASHCIASHCIGACVCGGALLDDGPTTTDHGRPTTDDLELGRDDALVAREAEDAVLLDDELEERGQLGLVVDEERARRRVADLDRVRASSATEPTTTEPKGAHGGTEVGTPKGGARSAHGGRCF